MIWLLAAPSFLTHDDVPFPLSQSFLFLSFYSLPLALVSKDGVDASADKKKTWSSSSVPPHCLVGGGSPLMHLINHLGWRDAGPMSREGSINPQL